MHPTWAPDSIDVSHPSAARVYDYLLGGAHNFAADRALGDELTRRSPEIAETMRANRVFLRRAVQFLVEAGVRQFVDIGSGIPTVGNVHEIAQRLAPDTTVVYIDVDPVAVAHSEAILAGDPRAAVLAGDLREPERILAEVRQLGLIDFHRPVAVLLAGVLHFLSDNDNPGGIVDALIEPLATGSYLLISHATFDEQPAALIEAQQLSARTSTQIHARPYAEVRGLFSGLRMIEPGVVFIPLWRPDLEDAIDRPERIAAYAGVGHKG
ncbi:SAM-dependent methyltransferase [Pilimelia columellifera]|uniref:SAM-dependent methyltransferase n=1 Tax=Pilimelia columellifera subsp. columellifera TaxID=706583 RepID=A0ABN3N749_9ACTN